MALQPQPHHAAARSHASGGMSSFSPTPPAATGAGTRQQPQPQPQQTPPPLRAHPILESLMQSLEGSGSSTARRTRAQAQQSAGSQSARVASHAAATTGAADPASTLRSLPPRRQSSAAMRRKLASLENAQHPLSPAHTAAALDGITAAESASSGAMHLPQSLVPASARVYNRTPLFPFVTSLDSTNLSQVPQRQWETLAFPSANPAASADGGEGEVRRLSAWFDQSWSQMEQAVQAQAAAEKREEMQRAAAYARAVTRGQDSASAGSGAEEEKLSAPSSSTALAGLSPKLVYALDTNREKLVFIVFHELLRHVTALCRRRGALLERVWQTQQALQESKMRYRLSEVIALAEAGAAARIRDLESACEERLRAERSVHIQAGVETTYLQAELEARERIIANLTEENDKDLLYSNQVVCHKEMALLRMEREHAQRFAESQKTVAELGRALDDKAHLEGALERLEQEKEELIKQCNQLQDILDARLRAQCHAASQYNAEDVPPEPSALEILQTRSATAIQGLFRGWRTRRKLKAHGMLSRKVILKRLAILRAGIVGRAGDASDPSASTAAAGSSLNSIPIPRSFLHLMHPHDMLANRHHFVRLFLRKNLCKWILNLYGEKSVQDYLLDRSNSGGGTHARGGSKAAAVFTPRKDLAEFLYDFSVSKHGSRDAAEMDLLDLFASVDKFAGAATAPDGAAAAAPRIKIFQTTLQQAWKHQRKAASTAAHGYHMTESERVSHDTLCQLRLSLHGGRNLSSRVLDFLLGFLRLSKEYGRGPFQALGDNNEGVMWIEFGSMIELVSAVCKRWSTGARETLMQRLHAKAEALGGAATRTHVLGLSGAPGAHSAAAAVDSLASMLTPRAAVATSALPASPAASEIERRFVDWDCMVELVLDAYVDEDSRMHCVLVDSFSNPAALEKRIKRAARGTGMPSLSIDWTDGIADVNAGQGATAGPEALEPEFYSFLHFSSTLRSLGCAWNEDLLLRVFQLSVQRAIHRAVSLDDFATVVRAFGIMPVDCDWEFGRNADARALGPDGMPVLLSAKEAMAMATASRRGDLPTLDGFDDDDADSGSNGGGPLGRDADLMERRVQELRDRLREQEATAQTKLDHAARKHGKELEALKSAHAAEADQAAQAHAAQIEALRRALDAEKTRAALEFNALVSRGASEARAAQVAAESLARKKDAQAETTLSNYQNRVTDDARMIELLQDKLASKSDKYARKKAAFAALQTRCAQAEAALNAANAAATPAAANASTAAQ